MTASHDPDWDPTAASVLENQQAAYDEMRRTCPVAYSTALGWSLFRHADVRAVLEDHETFSNMVSSHRSVPNGLDPPEHTAYRRAIEPYFAPEPLQQFGPICRQIAGDLLEPVRGRELVDYMEVFATPFAVRCQCAFLGWPHALAERIGDWTRRNQAATLARDRAVLSTLADEFRGYVSEVLEERRGAPASTDITTSLMQQTSVNGAPLSDEDLTSIFRNWTAGEVGSLASALGTLAEHLALDRALQERLRGEPSLVPIAIEEILRLSGPLVLNFRLAKRDVELGGRQIAAGERISLLWIAANRDERAFGDSTCLRLDRDPQASLLYGAGIHVCPGAPLARLELTIALEELLRCSRHVELARDAPGRRAHYPMNGWASLPLRFG
jgi:cytochrome P450